MNKSIFRKPGPTRGRFGFFALRSQGPTTLLTDELRRNSAGANPRRRLAPLLACLCFSIASGTGADIAHAADSPKGLDLVLLIGQSNMAGRGVVGPEDQRPHPRVFVLTQAKTWEPAVDPLHFDKPKIAGVGLASTFARTVAEARPYSRIGLIPAAFGGTSLDQWAPGGQLYVNAIERARLAQETGRLVAILWHQGEADSPPERAATYATRFKAFAEQLRADLGDPRLPLIIGQLGEFRPAFAHINEVLRQLPDQIPDCRFVSSAGLKDKGDQTHFDTPSLHEFGRRYAQAYLSLAKP